MYAFKLNPNENHKCRTCGEELPPYLTRHHKVIVFTKEQTELFNFNHLSGEYIEYKKDYPTVGIYEEECKGEIESLKTEVKDLNEEIGRLQKKLQYYENNQPLEHRRFIL